MSLLHRIFSRRRIYDDLSAEIEQHLDERTEVLVAEGMDREEAEHRARREFGNVALIEERGRTAWQWPRVESLWADLKYAWRQLRKSPGFTITAILTLTLGIGANTAMFTLVDVLMLKKLSLREPDRLVTLSTIDPAHPVAYPGAWPEGFTFPAYLQLAKEQKVFSHLVAYEEGATQSLQSDVSSEAGNVMWETGDFFSAAGVPPLLGRWITPEEDGSTNGERTKVAVISYHCWQTLFGGTPSVSGKTIRIDGDAFTVIGVMPKQFRALRIDSPPEAVVPLKRPVDASTFFYYILLGKLRTGISMDAARSQISTIWEQVKHDSVAPSWKDAQKRNFLSRRIALRSAATGFMYTRELYRKPLLGLWAMVGVVLLIACANLGTLMLGRTISRKHELAIRAALGASRFTLLRQILVECLMLALCGALPGLLIAFYASRWLAGEFWRSNYAMDLSFTPNATVLLFAVGATVLSVLLFGMVPAWIGSRNHPGLALQSAGRSVMRRGGSFAGNILLAGQIAFSFVLLAATVQLVFSMRALLHIDLGLEPNGVLGFSLIQRGAGYKNFDAEPYYRTLQEQIAQVPGVKSVGMGNILLFAPYFLTDKIATPDQKISVDASYARPITPGFFGTLKIPFESGRDFRFSDDVAHPNVAIINRSLAAELFPSGNAIGQHIRFLSYIGDPALTSDAEVIGIVGDANLDDPRHPMSPAVYISFFQKADYMRNPEILVQTIGDTEQIQKRVREIVASGGREDIWSTQTLNEKIDKALLTERMLALLATIFGVLALLLIGIGIAGLFSCLVAQRTQEIGLRMAFGAQRKDVLTMVLRQACAVVLWGVAAGLPFVWIATHQLNTFLYRHLALPLDVIAVWLLLMIAGVIAAYLPARRAASVDPMQALRSE